MVSSYSSKSRNTTMICFASIIFLISAIVASSDSTPSHLPNIARSRFRRQDDVEPAAPDAADESTAAGEAAAESTAAGEAAAGDTADSVSPNAAGNNTADGASATGTNQTDIAPTSEGEGGLGPWTVVAIMAAVIVLLAIVIILSCIIYFCTVRLTEKSNPVKEADMEDCEDEEDTEEHEDEEEEQGEQEGGTKKIRKGRRRRHVAACSYCPRTLKR